jgi:hypothetical protein
MVCHKLAWSAEPAAASPPTTYTGFANASAAEPLGESMFVVADDEDNTLAVYDRVKGGSPLKTFELNDFLKPDPAEPEVDIEGATQIGNRVYWISSHGRNRKGKVRPSRSRLFATEFVVNGASVTLKFIGQPYKTLLADITAAPQLTKYNLARASEIAPKEPGGFNIEGLAATPSGDALLIGLRNPIRQGKAIVITLQNPAEAVSGGKARIGEAIELDLGGLGVRSMEYWPERKYYVVVAGPADSGDCQLYTWSGANTDAPRRMEAIDIGDYTPESLVIYPDSAQQGIQIISDDGSRKQNLNVKPSERTFRAIWVKL